MMSLDKNEADRFCSVLKEAARLKSKQSLELLLASDYVKAFGWALLLSPLKETLRFNEVRAAQNILRLCIAKGLPQKQWSMVIAEACRSEDEMFKMVIQEALGVGVDMKKACINAMTIQLLDRSYMDLMIQAGADPNSKRDSGLKPLMNVAREGDVVWVKKLLDYGATVEGQHHVGNDAQIEACVCTLDYAVVSGVSEVVRLILESYSEWSAQVLGSALSIEAARNNRLEPGGDSSLSIAKMLIDKGADVEGGPNSISAQSPLVGALYVNHKEMVKLLLDSGASMKVNEHFAQKNQVDILGLVMDYGDEDMALMLLAAGADGRQKSYRHSNQKESLLSYSKRHGWLQVEGWIESAKEVKVLARHIKNERALLQKNRVRL